MGFCICTDVGGTNMTVGLFKIEMKTNHDVDFTLLDHKAYKSQEQKGILPGLKDAIHYFKHTYTLSKTPPINISACGPTDGEICQPTNLAQGIWRIDKNEIQKQFDTPVFLINDFAGISYGLMTIYESLDSKIRHIPHSPQADFSHTTKSIKVALGAGTGLGCATIYNESYKTSLISSEAGWLHFTPDTNNHYELSYMYFLSSLSPDGAKPVDLKKAEFSWEDAISASRGIINIYDFFCNAHYSLDIISESERNSLLQIKAMYQRNTISQNISRLAKSGDTGAKRIMDFWICLYARYAQQIALVTIPNGGVFIGGGAAAKNIDFFLQDDLFLKIFRTQANKEIQKLLLDIPLYIITDYLISLYGNAYHFYISSK